MKEKLVTAFVNIIKIKSIVTITATIVFAILAIKGTISAEQFLTIYTMVVGFYFGTQKVKETEIDDPKDNVVEEDINGYYYKDENKL